MTETTGGSRGSATEQGRTTDGGVAHHPGPSGFEPSATPGGTARFEVDTNRLRRAATRLAGLRDRLADPVAPAPTGRPAAAGLVGWSCEAALARLDAGWAAAVAGLVEGCADHADQLRAAAERYEDATRIVARALDEAAGP